MPPGGNVAASLASLPAGWTLLLQRGATYNLLAPLSVNKDHLAITAAGDPAKPLPIIHWPTGAGINVQIRNGFTLRQIELRCDKVTSSKDVGLHLYGCADVAIDGCRISGFTFGVTAEACHGVILQQSAIFDIWSAGAAQRSTGFYADDCTNLTLSGNRFDRCGWRNATTRDWDQNQNVYITGRCDPVHFIGNVSSRANNYGLQARSGGIVESNLFIDNANDCSFGYVAGGGPVRAGGAIGAVTRNAFISGTTGPALTVGNIAKLAITGNLFAGSKSSAFAAIQTGPCMLQPDNTYLGTPAGKPVGIVDLTVAGNVSQDWPKQYAESTWIKPGWFGNGYLGKRDVQKTWTGHPADFRAMVGANPHDASMVAKLLAAAGI